jgi:hypothetical protein
MVGPAPAHKLRKPPSFQSPRSTKLRLVSCKDPGDAACRRVLAASIGSTIAHMTQPATPPARTAVPNSASTEACDGVETSGFAVRSVGGEDGAGDRIERFTACIPKILSATEVLLTMGKQRAWCTNTPLTIKAKIPLITYRSIVLQARIDRGAWGGEWL